MRELEDNPALQLTGLLGVVQSEIAKAVVGQEDTVELILTAALARGHVLLEGPPGVAKTLIANAIARVLGAKFQRIQFTSDTTPSEIVGELVVRSGETVFERGAVFTNVLLADEINRTPPRTQAALLEAMQERHVSLRGRSYWIDPPFLVIATQNAHEHQGVYPLPESQLDRFLVKIEIDYGSAEDELRVLDLPHRGTTPDTIGEIVPLLGDRGFLVAQDAVDSVTVPAAVARLLLEIIRATRDDPDEELGASTRAAIHLMAGARARAALRGRTTVDVEDVLSLAPHVLCHRMQAEDPRELVARAITRALTTAP